MMRMRSQRTWPFWLRRDNERCQSQPTRNRKSPAPVGSWALRSIGSVHPLTTACSQLPCLGMGSCIRRRRSAFTSFSFVCSLLRIVCRNTVNRPLRLFFTQLCVKPKKLNASGFPHPRHRRWTIACGPNSKSRVFTGCSSRWNFFMRSVSSARNMGHCVS